MSDYKTIIRNGCNSQPPSDESNPGASRRRRASQRLSDSGCSRNDAPSDSCCVAIQTDAALKVLRTARCACRRGRAWWTRPRHSVEVEEVQQVWLRRITVGQVSTAADKATLDELDNRRVVHRHMRNKMPSREWRDHDIGNAEAKLRRESLLRGSIG